MDYIVYIETIGFSCAIFLAIILCLAIPPKYTKKILSWIAIFSVISALCLYGYGYGYTYLYGDTHTIVTGIIMTVFDTCRIIFGSNNWHAVVAAYEGKIGWEIFFWIVHLLAMTTTVSAAIVSLGSELLKKIRLRILRKRDVAIIFGLNENTLDFGRELSENRKISVLYVDKNPESSLSILVERMGALLRSDADAWNGNGRFLKSIGLKPGKRKLYVYALDASIRVNRQFARQLLSTLEQQNILSEQTSLTILCADDETDDFLQASGDHYGYGNLLSINEPDMLARIMVRICPPYKSLQFDRDGAAVTDFHGVVVGFGDTGQAVLRQLVMNSQFRGSSGKISVFAPDYERQMGWLSHECREMLKHYDIMLYPYDGRSSQFYDYIEEHAASIGYIAVCAGSESINLEIAERLQHFLRKRDRLLSVLVCSRNGVIQLLPEGTTRFHRIYIPQILCSDQIDRMAMVLNQSYIGSGDMRENWKKSSYFDRMSSRSAADFYEALLYSAGVTREEALKKWDPQGKLLENLAATEHLRWNAFHYCMGFRPMTEEEYRNRVQQYFEEKKRDPQTKFRIAKDMKNQLHACMIPWEDLDAYSVKENAITGSNRDYAESDRRNVRSIPDIIRMMEQTTAER